MKTNFNATFSLSCLLFVLLSSFFTYMYNFAHPADLFWDENYHIASAQKYLNGTFFMEPHPPLGKMMIALGEYLLDMNPDDTQFLDTDYGKKIPVGFSFLGYRFFPTLFAWLCAPLFFGIIWKITKNNLWAVLISFVYVFDNALIVHQRSAMLESTLHFFALATIFLWLVLLQHKRTDSIFWWSAIGLGATFGAALATKANGLIFILLWPMVFLHVWPNTKKFVQIAAASMVGFFVVYCSIWYAHFAIATQIEPDLPDNGYYQASEEYKFYLQNGSTTNPLYFPVMLHDSWNFLTHYANGVPKLDLCKEGENGSPWFYWPFGGRTINYRWKTQGSDYYQYLYLVPNPAGWTLGIIGVLGSVGIVFSSIFFGRKIKQPIVLYTITGIYIAYMITMARIDRVMYLYHYFIPLLLSFILFALVIQEVPKFFSVTLNQEVKTALLLLASGMVFITYLFYRPLSYYEPLTDAQVMYRAITPVWDLRCVRCRNQRYLHPKLCS